MAQETAQTPGPDPRTPTQLQELLAENPLQVDVSTRFGLGNA